MNEESPDPRRRKRKKKDTLKSVSFFLVDSKGIEPSTSAMRTQRSRKVVSFLPMDCGVWFDENDRRGAIKNTAFSVPIRN